MAYKSSIFLLMPKLDSDAMAFITAHESATGVTMGNVQRNAVNNRYLRYKGILPNPNGSNLWALYQSLPTLPRIWIHCPSNDTTASLAGFNIEFLTQTSLGTFNFGGSGPNVYGLIGGTGKYFDAGISPSAYPQNDFAYGFYNRSSYQNQSFEAGCVDGSNVNTIAIRRNTGSNTFYRNNEAVASPSIALVSAPNSLGSILCSRSSSTNERLTKGTTLLDSKTSTSSPGGAQNMYFHATNIGGVLSGESPRQLAGYNMGLPNLTANQLADYDWIEQLWHTECVTGGRQV